MTRHFPDGPTRHPTANPTGKTLANRATRRPDAYSSAPVCETRNTSRTCAQTNLLRDACTLPVGPSGAPIHAGLACRVMRRVARRAVGRVNSLTYTHKKIKGEGSEEQTHWQQMTKPLRLQMPHTAAFIDQLRLAFGGESIDRQIRAGINGQPVFNARENGHEIGAALPCCDKGRIAMSDIDLKPFNATAAHSASRTKGK